MKTRALVSIVILVLAVLIVAGSCATRRSIDTTPRIVEGPVRDGREVIHEYYFDWKVDPEFAPQRVEGGIRFAVPAGGYESMYISGTFNGWSRTEKMQLENGVFSIVLHLDAGKKHCYKFIADNEYWLHDPNHPDLVHDDFYALNTRLNLDENGNILPYDPHGYFTRRTTCGNLVMYTDGRKFRSENEIENFLFDVAEIAGAINDWGNWTDRNRYRKISILWLYGGTGGGYDSRDFFTWNGNTISDVNYWSIAHELVHVLSGLNKESHSFQSEGLADSVSILINRPGQPSDGGITYIEQFINWYFLEDHYLAPSYVNSLGLLILANYHTDFLYRTAGTFYLYILEEYGKCAVLDFTATGDPADLGKEATWDELDSGYRAFIEEFAHTM
jgi:hypothetical protein